MPQLPLRPNHQHTTISSCQKGPGTTPLPPRAQFSRRLDLGTLPRSPKLPFPSNHAYTPESKKKINSCFPFRGNVYKAQNTKLLLQQIHAIFPKFRSKRACCGMERRKCEPSEIAPLGSIRCCSWGLVNGGNLGVRRQGLSEYELHAYRARSRSTELRALVV